MFICEGIFNDATEKLRKLVSISHPKLYVVAVLGGKLSGKLSLCKQALELESIEFKLRKLVEVSGDSLGDFITSINSGGCVVLQQYGDLPIEHRSALSDYVLSVRLGIVQGPSENGVWIIPTSERLSFVDATVEIPDLSTSVVTRRIVCERLLSGFPVDTSCPLLDVLFHSSAKLSIGNLCALVRTAKLDALSDVQGPNLSCTHLSKSYHSLLLPCEPVLCHTESHYHSCCIIFQPNPLLSSFIGLPSETRDTIDQYMHAPLGKCLLIAGPIGCGKSHLARAICYHPSVRTVHLSSADILTAKIGETEKTFFRLLSSHSRLVIEDIDQILTDSSTGSVQRCWAVLVSFLDRWKYGIEFEPDRLIVATTRNGVDTGNGSKFDMITLSNKLSFRTKLDLIQSEIPDFPETTKPFDLIHLNNRAECILFAKDLKLSKLRSSINS